MERRGLFSPASFGFGESPWFSALKDYFEDIRGT
jgi:hypothetical protein